MIFNFFKTEKKQEKEFLTMDDLCAQKQKLIEKKKLESEKHEKDKQNAIELMKKEIIRKCKDIRNINDKNISFYFYQNNYIDITLFSEEECLEIIESAVKKAIPNIKVYIESNMNRYKNVYYTRFADYLKITITIPLRCK